MKGEQEFFKISLEDFDKHCRSLGIFIGEQFKDKDITLVALIRGGLPALTWISHASKINKCGTLYVQMTQKSGYNQESTPVIGELALAHGENKKSKIILIDEIYETGKSMTYAKKHLESLGHEVLASFVIVSKSDITAPYTDSISHIDPNITYHCLKCNKNLWVEFPWE